MDLRDATALIERALPHRAETWADLGAGTGTFTFALAALLSPGGKVIAVDRDPAALEALRAAAVELKDGSSITTLSGDFTRQLALPTLDGALLANALHFVAEEDQPLILRRLAAHLRPNGRLVVVEYEGRRPSRWVPHPVSWARLREHARAAGLGEPSLVGTRRSMFGGSMYAAVMDKSENSSSPAREP